MSHMGLASVLSLIGSKTAGKVPVMNESDLLDVIKLEESKYTSICTAVCSDPSMYMVHNIFDLALFWAGQKTVLPSTMTSGWRRLAAPRWQAQTWRRCLVEQGASA